MMKADELVYVQLVRTKQDSSNAQQIESVRRALDQCHAEIKKVSPLRRARERLAAAKLGIRAAEKAVEAVQQEEREHAARKAQFNKWLKRII